MNQVRRGYEKLRDTSPLGSVVRRHHPDYQIVLFMAILVIIGLIVLFAISPARVQLINAGGSDLDQNHFMQKQLIYLFIGISAFAFAASFPLKWWQKYSSKILLAGFGACFLLAFLGLFMDGGIVLKAGGATRWFDVGFGTFQPAELLKFGLLLFVAAFLGRRMRQGNVNNLQDTLIPLGIVVGAATLIIIGAQKDMGTGLTMLGMVGVMVVIAGLSTKYMLRLLPLALLAGVAFIMFSPHRMERVITFFSPEQAGAAESYHIEQATIAIGSGGLTGRGLGQGRAAFGYLPEAVNDSIFAIFGETFGFVGLVAVLGVFCALLMRLLRAMDRVIEPEQRLLLAGVFGLLMTHLAVNVGAMTGIVPLTGVTLPFLSFGGTSLLFTMMALGIAFQATRYTTHSKLYETKERSEDESTHSRRRIGGTRYTSPRRTRRA